MSKKEKNFPLNTVGGKIGELRKKAGLSRSQLYDLVYEISGCDYRAGSDASKEKTVYNWESGKTQLNYEVMIAICKTLKCSADYLLGLDECTNKTVQFIHEKTGLSEDAINRLRQLKDLQSLFPEAQSSKDKFKVINLILSDQKKANELSSLLEYLVSFCRFNISPDANPTYTVDKNGICHYHPRKSLSGSGYVYNPLKAHFKLQDMESMYYLKIWDSIKELKEMYKKAPDTN